MFDIPKRYEINLVVNIKDFIPKELKPKEKKRIRDAIKTVRLTYQIAGEEIPSLINDRYRCEVIQFYEIELISIKDANHIALIYQRLIKPLCVMRLYDSREEIYSFADKRLSMTEENQIVIEDAYISQRYPYGLPGDGMKQYTEYLSFDKVKNKTDKLSLYREWMYKIYLLEHSDAFAKVELILQGNAWYSTTRAASIYQKYATLVRARDVVSKAQINADKIKANKAVQVAKDAIEQEL